MEGQQRMRALSPVILVFALFISGCATAPVRETAGVSGQADRIEEVPDIVTGDIQEGIEQHIEEQVALGKGYFRIPFEGRELQLDLVRVHTEYLATLSPTRHFACVDMVSADGEFYDVDFFMEGPRGNMKVTEATVHKLNGRPFYVWAQGEDKTWGRVPPDEATNELLGILEGEDKFLFRYETVLPEITNEARIWIPLAQSNDFQRVRVVSVEAPEGYQTLTDGVYGNKALFFTASPQDSGKRIVIHYDVARLEKSVYAGDPEEARRYLAQDLKVPNKEGIQAAADEIVLGKEGDLMRARALYDYVIDVMDYKRCGVGWGRGDVSHARSALSGNCTDFHSYFIAMARSIGIPARFAIGFSIPSERDEGAIEGYHCWAEFYAEGKWWPVDISEANKFTALSMYFFGHHPANRFEFTRGRDLVFDPGPASGPINFLAYPVMEVDGQAQQAKIAFGFERRQEGLSLLNVKSEK